MPTAKQEPSENGLHRVILGPMPPPARKPWEVVWHNEPKVTRLVGPAMKVRPEDHGRYIIAKYDDQKEDMYFMTPETAVDGMFWTNGLDGKDCLHEAFALFDSPPEAGEAIHRYKRKGSLLFQVTVSPGTVTLVLVDSEPEFDEEAPRGTLDLGGK